LEKAPQIVNAKNRNPNRRFQFHKRSQLFIRVHNETLSVAAMRLQRRIVRPIFRFLNAE
jgi:hypothetical protein